MKRFYDIKFELEAKGKNKGELLTKYEKLLKEDAVKFFNDKSSRVRKPKRILEVEINDDNTLIVSLESAEELVAPAKAMRAYSSYLKNNGMEQLAEGNALFRSVDVKESVRGIDDEQLIHLIVRSIYRKNKSDKEFISKVKQLAEEMGME